MSELRLGDVCVGVGEDGPADELYLVTDVRRPTWPTGVCVTGPRRGLRFGLGNCEVAPPPWPEEVAVAAAEFALTGKVTI